MRRFDGCVVHYRTCAGELSGARRAALSAVLDDAERARMARFRFAVDRDLYLQAHALLRAVLGHYLAADPRALRFATQAHGRPELAFPACAPRLRFSLTHTPGFAACAVAWTADVGVDAEYRGRRVDIAALAPRVLSEAERDDLTRMADPQAQRNRFFEYWTLKEAYVKAHGDGLRLPLSGVTVRPHAPRANHATLSLSGIDDDPGRYQLRLCSPLDSHQVAVAVATHRDAPIAFTPWG